MITSKEQNFSEDQAITGDEASDNIIDLGAPGTVLGAPAALIRDIGKGTVIPLLIQVTEDFDALTSLRVEMRTDNDPAFGSPTTVARSEEVLLADLVAGYRFKPLTRVPEGVVERYVRLHYEVTGANPTVGKIWAGPVAAVQTNERAPGA